MASSVTFYEGTSDEFKAATNRDANGIYFIRDSKKIYKGDVSYGGTDVPVATSSVAGKVKVGSDFDVTSDCTISLYKAIAVNSMSNNVNNVEKGTKVSSATITWSLNKTPASQTLTKGSETYSLAASDTSKVIAFSPELTSADFASGDTNGTFKVKDKGVAITGLKSAAYVDVSTFQEKLVWNPIV